MFPSKLCLDGQCELKFDLIHLLPKFHGLAGEDPHKHLKEFHTVCTTMRPAVHGVHEMTTSYAVDHAQMKAQLHDLTSMMKQLTMP